MGLFDYFSKDAALVRRRERALKKLTNMYYQTADRLGAADVVFELAEQGDREAVNVLLARFEHLCPSSTVDREEKDYVVNLLVALGDKAVEPIVDYCKTTQKAIYWPLKVVERLWTADVYADFVAEVLEGTDNGYWRAPDKKIGVVQLAASIHTSRIDAAILPFVEDHTEEVRFAAVDALLNREEDVRETLLPRLAGDEESLRIRRRLAEGFVAKGWSVEERAEDVVSSLPPGFSVQGARVVAK